MKGLFLDDERIPSDVTWLTYAQGIEWIIVRTFDEFKAALEKGANVFDLISFDHDIQDFDEHGVERDGYTCFKWLSELCLDTGRPPPVCIVHSKNPCGSENIRCHYQNLCEYFRSTGAE